MAATASADALPVYLSGRTTADGLPLPAYLFGAERGPLRLGWWLASVAGIAALIVGVVVTSGMDPFPFVAGNRVEMHPWEPFATVLALGALPWLFWTGHVFQGPERERMRRSVALETRYAVEVLGPYLRDRYGVRLPEDTLLILLSGNRPRWSLRREDGTWANDARLVLRGGRDIREVARPSEYRGDAEEIEVSLDVVETVVVTTTSRTYPFPYGGGAARQGA